MFSQSIPLGKRPLQRGAMCTCQEIPSASSEGQQSYLNIEGLTVSKMNVLYHLAVQYEAFVILLEETQCTRADKLAIPDFALAGYSLTRKHGHAMFAHDRVRWTLVDQSPTTSESEWLCMDIDVCKIVNVYKPSPTQLQASDLPVFLTPISMQAILLVRMSTGVMEPAVPCCLGKPYWPCLSPQPKGCGQWHQP